MKIPIKKTLTIFFICSLSFLFSTNPVRAQTSEEPLTASFAPELTPGSNFTWVVNEWDQLDDWLNPEANYTPKPGDLWTMEVKGELPEIPVGPTSTWDILGWYVEDFNFPTLDPKENVELNISGHSFFDVFGNESDNGYNWKMVNQLFLLPYTVEDETGVKVKFSKFYGATFDNIEGEVDVETSDGDLKLNGTINGKYENTTIDLNCHLGLREEFAYKKKPVGSELFKGIINITLIESEFNMVPRPDIPGYTYLLGIGLIFIGVITVLVQRQTTKGKKKKG